VGFGIPLSLGLSISDLRDVIMFVYMHTHTHTMSIMHQGMDGATNALDPGLNQFKVSNVPKIPTDSRRL